MEALTTLKDYLTALKGREVVMDGIYAEWPGPSLRKLRKGRMKQKDIAKLLNIEQCVVSWFESGVHNRIGIDTLIQLTDLYLSLEQGWNSQTMSAMPRVSPSASGETQNPNPSLT